MKKHAGAEKKRVKRSLGSASSTARDSGSDPPARKQGVKKDVFQLFAEKVRDNKGLESRWAVMEEARVEYFRGKDFVSFLKNHPVAEPRYVRGGQLPPVLFQNPV